MIIVKSMFFKNSKGEIRKTISPLLFLTSQDNNLTDRHRWFISLKETS